MISIVLACFSIGKEREEVGRASFGRSPAMGVSDVHFGFVMHGLVCIAFLRVAAQPRLVCFSCSSLSLSGLWPFDALSFVWAPDLNIQATDAALICLSGSRMPVTVTMGFGAPPLLSCRVFFELYRSVLSM